MPPFSHLRSDYPLNLTLLERPYAGALTQFYTAGLTSARGIPVSLIGSNWWFLSRPLVNRAFDARHYSGTIGRHFHSVEPRICTGSRTNFCSSACAPSTSESSCGLTHVRALVRAFRLNIDEQLAHLVEHWCARPRGNTELDFRELAASLSPKSAACVVVAVHLPSTSGPHSPRPTVLCPAFEMRTRRKKCASGLSLSGVPVRGQQGKSDQLKSDQLRRST